MGLEIERKFKIRELPSDYKKAPSKKIFQGYLAVCENGTEIRVRKYGNKFFETIKSRGTLVREETEIELSKTQFMKLWPLTKGKRIEKQRYEYKLNNKIIYIDVYMGKLKSLAVAEIEFANVASSKNFKRPPWFGGEITKNAKYKNKHLAQLFNLMNF